MSSYKYRQEFEYASDIEKLNSSYSFQQDYYCRMMMRMMRMMKY